MLFVNTRLPQFLSSWSWVARLANQGRHILIPLLCHHWRHSWIYICPCMSRISNHWETAWICFMLVCNIYNPFYTQSQNNLNTHFIIEIRDICDWQLLGFWQIKSPVTAVTVHTSKNKLVWIASSSKKRRQLRLKNITDFLRRSFPWKVLLFVCV